MWDLIVSVPDHCLSFYFVNVPLHNINVSSDLVTGPVAVDIRPSLPFKGVHLLLSKEIRLS